MNRWAVSAPTSSVATCSVVRTAFATAVSRSADAEEDSVLTEAEMRGREKENLRRALRQARWKIYGPDGAAALLGVKPTTLVSRIKRLGLERGRGRARQS